VDDLLSAGRQAAERGELQQALELLDRVIDRDERCWDALRLRGTLLLHLNQVERAVSDLDLAAEGMVDCAACHYERAVARLRGGQLQPALDAFERCLELDHEHAPAHAMRAATLLRLGRARDALEAISTTIALRSDRARDLHNRAVVLTALGRLDEAIRDYERALELDPDSGGTLNNLASLLATAADPSLRDGRRALELARRATARASAGSWLDTLAAAHAECGEFEAAIRAEMAAYEKSNRRNEAFRRRIDAYRKELSFAD